jgi:hypothetical protein
MRGHARYSAYCGRGLALCERVHIRQTFFLPAVACWHFSEVAALTRNVRCRGTTGNGQRVVRTTRLTQERHHEFQP